jgi:cytochrome c oxidase cbb3-type subunit I
MTSTSAFPADENAIDKLTRIMIDHSTRVPVLLWMTSSVFWLIMGSIAALIASIKLHNPGFLGGIEWLTFGRIRPVHLDIVFFGWACMAAVGVLLWLQARLCHVKLPAPLLLSSMAMLWNLGVLGGVVAVLAGYGSSIEYLEFPAWTAPFFAIPAVALLIVNITMYAKSNTGHTYVSQWYMLAATVWLPVLYVTAMICTYFGYVQGVSQAITNWWFGHNALGLWVTPIAVATAYYLIPKVTGKPVHSYHLSLLGFWSLAIFYNWAGTHHLTGGPLPAWTITLGVVGSMMMFIPVITVAINHHMTMKGVFHMLKTSPTLRFTVFGSFFYTISSFQGSLESLRSHQEVTHFTQYTIGHAHVGLYGFFSMIMFGSIYYIFPRITNNEWSSARMIKIHFWGSSVGVVAYGLALCWAGWQQGLMMIDPAIPFLKIVEYLKPYLILRSVAGMAMTIGHIALAISVMRILSRHHFTLTGPTLFNTERPAWREFVNEQERRESSVVSAEVKQ